MKISKHVVLATGLLAGISMGQTADAGLIGHYTFDADVTDSAGSRHGTAFGNAAIDNGVVAAVPGGSTGSLNLTNGGYVALPSTTTDTFDEYTIAMWVRVNGDNGFISGLYTSDTFNAQAIHINHHTEGTPRLEASIGGFGTPMYEVSAAPVDWVHMAIVHQTVGGGTQMYINGDEVDSVDTGGPTSILDAVQVGNWAGQDRQFNGWIDDLRIYDEVLTAGQIEDLAGVPEPGSLALLGMGGLLIARRRRS